MNKPNIAYVRLTDEQVAGLEILTKEEPGNKSDHIRQGLNEYLQRKLTERYARRSLARAAQIASGKEVADESQLEQLRNGG